MKQIPEQYLQVANDWQKITSYFEEKCDHEISSYRRLLYLVCYWKVARCKMRKQDFDDLTSRIFFSSAEHNVKYQEFRVLFEQHFVAEDDQNTPIDLELLDALKFVSGSTSDSDSQGKQDQPQDGMPEKKPDRHLIPGCTVDELTTIELISMKRLEEILHTSRTINKFGFGYLIFALLLLCLGLLVRFLPAGFFSVLDPACTRVLFHHLLALSGLLLTQGLVLIFFRSSWGRWLIMPVFFLFLLLFLKNTTNTYEKTGPLLSNLPFILVSIAIVIGIARFLLVFDSSILSFFWSNVPSHAKISETWLKRSGKVPSGQLSRLTEKIRPVINVLFLGIALFAILYMFFPVRINPNLNLRMYAEPASAVSLITGEILRALPLKMDNPCLKIRAFMINGLERTATEAQFSFAEYLEKGPKNIQNPAEAAKWYRKAAENNYPRAQYILGLYCENGVGTPKDPAEAAKWYRKAAENGIPEAQYNLGFCYENGFGVPQEMAEAEKWYRKAAEKDHADARKRLEWIQSSRSVAPAVIPQTAVPAALPLSAETVQDAEQTAQAPGSETVHNAEPTGAPAAEAAQDAEQTEREHAAEAAQDAEQTEREHAAENGAPDL